MPPRDLTLSNNKIIGIDKTPVFTGILNCIDDDQETGHLFSMAGDNDTVPDNAFFDVSNDSLFLINPQPVENKENYIIEISATDSMNNMISKQFLISVKEKLGTSDFYLTNDHFFRRTSHLIP